LPPGRYSFRVTASNSDGVWNEQAATLGFSVLAAYYQTNWFRGLVALVSLALVWLAYEWPVRQLRRAYEATLDARVAERTRIARYLQDTLLQSFHALALRFQEVLNVLPDGPPVEAKSLDGSAYERASRVITRTGGSRRFPRTAKTRLRNGRAEWRRCCPRWRQRRRSRE
jgi:signal transduction histidine kinase